MQDVRSRSFVSVSMLCLAFALVFMFGSAARAQAHNPEGSNDKSQTTREGDFYRVHLEFLDARDQPRAVDVSYPARLTDEMIRRYGVSPSMYDAYKESEEDAHVASAKAGLFKIHGEMLTPSYSDIVSYYAETFGKPIADKLEKMLQADGYDTPRNRIEIAQLLVEAIPYAIPDDMDDGRVTGGIAPVPKVLRDMSGDCDSKALLFASILAYLIDPSDVLFVHAPRHVFVAVNIDPQKGDTYFEIDKRKYVVAETAGPARLRLGEPGDALRSNGNKVDKSEGLTFKAAYKEELDQDDQMRADTAPPKGASDIAFANGCSNMIKLAIQFVQLNGQVATKGWYWLPPGESLHIEYTRNSIYYYYAVSSQNEVWSEAHDAAFRGKIYPFKQASIANQPKRLTCQ